MPDYGVEIAWDKHWSLQTLSKKDLERPCYWLLNTWTKKCCSYSMCASHEPSPLFCQNPVFHFNSISSTITHPKIFPGLNSGLQEQLLFSICPLEYLHQLIFFYYLLPLSVFLHLSGSFSSLPAFLIFSKQELSSPSITTKLSAEENPCTQPHIWDKLQQPGEAGKRQQYLVSLLVGISSIGIPQPLSQVRYFFEVDAESSPSERFSLP